MKAGAARMHKLKANTVADLVRTSERLGGLTSGH